MTFGLFAMGLLGLLLIGWGLASLPISEFWSRCESPRYEKTVALWNGLVETFDLGLRPWSECAPSQTIAKLNRLIETFYLPAFPRGLE